MYNLFCIRILFLADPRHNRNFLVLEVKVSAFEMNNYLFFKVNIIAEFFKRKVQFLREKFTILKIHLHYISSAIPRTYFRGFVKQT